MTVNTTLKPSVIPGEQAQALLREVATWGNVTTIVIHLGSVFEYKGPFPTGTEGFGFYNLDGPTPGFHGHLKLDAVDYIAFQTKPHRGRESYALVFKTVDDDVVFKIFLGRDTDGELLAHQVAAFQQLMETNGLKSAS